MDLAKEDGTVGHNNVSQMLAEIRRKLGDKNCIGTLEIHGHADPFDMYIGEDRGGPKGRIDSPIAQANLLNSTSVVPFAKELNKLRWCCDAEIILNGCNTGLLKPVPGKPSWVQTLADETGLTVTSMGGYAAGTYFHGNHGISSTNDKGVPRLETDEQYGARDNHEVTNLPRRKIRANCCDLD